MSAPVWPAPAHAPAHVLLLSDPEQVRLLADPLRMRIIEALQREPATAKQVALAIGEKPSRIYHHVELLERAALVRLVETRRKRGTIERYLAAAARAFVVDGALFAPRRVAATGEATEPPRPTVVDVLLDSAQELRRSIADGLVPVDDPDRCELARIPLRLTVDQARKVMRQLRTLLDDAIAAPPAAEGANYQLLLGFYPVDSGNGERSGEGSEKGR